MVIGAKRNITQLLVNMPGLTSYDPNNHESATWTPRVNGSLTGNTESFIDGGPGSGISTGRGALEEVGPAVEMVGEFSLVANAFNAEYGGFGNWFTNVTIKSGTNAYHGSVYNHYENNAFKARTFFQPRLSHGNQNEGGVTFGGPVIIPKIYNGRNKTFFFVSEGLYFTRNGPSLDFRTVPTAAFKQGDFSKLVNSAGVQIPIFDPSTTTPDGNGSFVREQFPNNIIPTSKISPIAKKIVPFMTDPDLPGVLTQNFYSRSFSGTQWPFFNNYVTTVKVDHSVSTKQKVSVLYTNQIRHRQLQGQGQGWVPRVPWGSQQENPLDDIIFQTANSWRARVNHDYIVSPTMLNHVTVSVDRYVNLGPNATTGGGWDQKLGIKGFPQDNGTFPAISFAGGTAAPMNLGRGYDNRAFEMRSRIDESFTWTRGTHSMKFGAYYAWNQTNSINLGSISGSFTFSNTQTSQPNATSTNYNAWGHSLASFLVGAVNNASATFTDMIGNRIRTMAVFAQDDWHDTSKLTLSYGIRWDYTQPPFEVNNKQSSFAPELKNPAAGNLLGALAFSSTYSRPFMDPWKKGFGPRLGMAYQMGGKTVLRASGGLYYATPALGINTTGYTNSPSFGSPDGFTPAYNWDTAAFPQNYQVPPIVDPSFSNGQSITWTPRNRGRLPQIASWTFGIQRELARGTSVDVSYIGSHSTHLDIGTSLNVVDVKNLSLGTTLLQNITSATAVAAGFREPFPGFANQTSANTVAAALKPYPQYTAVNVSSGPDGIGRMNSLQIKGNKRFSNGLTLISYFTWMKNFTNNSAQYPLDRDSGISVDSTSVPAVFGLTWTYDLPFGEGRRLANFSNPIAKRLVSGWAFNGFLRYQSGNALSIGGGNNTLSTLGYNGKTANYLGGATTLATNPRDFEPSKDRYLNAAAFGIPGQFAFGNLAPTLDWLRGFTVKSESVQLSKNTRINERMGLELSLDLANPFNFHRWLNPSTSISDSLNFGRVTGAGNGRAAQISANLKF